MVLKPGVAPPPPTEHSMSDSHPIMLGVEVVATCYSTDMDLSLWSGIDIQSVEAPCDHLHEDRHYRR